ncbi:MAG: group II truncated hemoglobin [Pseudomonadales bacterium]|nr:group II truncated hemoglobin [Pseudomonadales bacterium]
MTHRNAYGIDDYTYRSAGGEPGIRALVDTFYDLMSTNPDYRTIWSWHPQDNRTSRDKLARFLCGWMGGPRRYQEKYGAISIPQVHAHLKITKVERDQWLRCMTEDLELRAYPQPFIDYLIAQLAKPAELIRSTCEHREAGAFTSSIEES